MILIALEKCAGTWTEVDAPAARVAPRRHCRAHLGEHHCVPPLWEAQFSPAHVHKKNR
jgi:hypothetical protein